MKSGEKDCRWRGEIEQRELTSASDAQAEPVKDAGAAEVGGGLKEAKGVRELESHPGPQFVGGDHDGARERGVIEIRSVLVGGADAEPFCQVRVAHEQKGVG